MTIKFQPFFFALFALATVELSAQSDCETWFPIHEGTEYEYTYYDKKDRKQGSTTHDVFLVEEEDGQTIATIEVKYRDDKGDRVYEGEFEVICEQGTFKTDLSNMIDQSFRENAINAEMEISGTQVELPAELERGQELPDAETLIEITTNGVKLPSTEVYIYDRKVVREEEVTTPAGTFQCYKITYTSESKTSIIKKTNEVAEWWAKGVGMVRSETYKGNGKVVAYQVLTALKKY